MTPLRSRYAYLNVWKTPEDPFVENGPIIKVKESVEVKLTCVARNGKPPAKVSAAMALKMYNYDDFCCCSRTRNHKSFWRKKDAGFSQLVQKMPILHSLATWQNSSFSRSQQKNNKMRNIKNLSFFEIMSNDHRVFFAKVEGPCTFAACCLAKKWISRGQCCTIRSHAPIISYTHLSLE